MSKEISEVLIIGGGPAGMSAALVLGRSRIKTIILNTENARNMVTQHSHGFLTQDGAHPSEILKIAKEQLLKYKSVVYKKEKALDLIPNGDHFQVKTENQVYLTKRVIIATGYKDNVDQVGIEGLAEVYGKSVYPCPFCDGFENADKKLAVFGDAVMAPMFSKTIAHWSNNVIVFTNGDQMKDKELLSSLQKNGIEVIEQKIDKLLSKDGILEAVQLQGGRIIKREGGFLPDTKAVESTDFAKKLKVATEEGHFGMEMYKVDENKETEIKGLYIIGDARSGWGGVAKSVAEGSEVGAAITHQIISEKWAV